MIGVPTLAGAPIMLWSEQLPIRAICLNSRDLFQHHISGSIGPEMLSEPSTLINTARVIGNCLQEDYGIDPASLYADLDINTKEFFKPGARTSFKQMNQLWIDAAAAAGDPWFGFSVGKRATPSDFFVLGHAWMASGSLQGALNRLCRYIHVLTTVKSGMTLTEKEDGYVLSETTPEGAQVPSKFAVDAGLVALIGLIDTVTQETIRPKQVSLTISSDYESERYEELFQCPVSLGCDTESWLFASSDLEQPLSGSIPDVASATDRIAGDYIQSLEHNTIATSVSRMLIQTLPSGRSDQDTVARRLYRSRSTLQRQLSAEGTSYREILEETRRDLAERYLKEGDYSQAQIAFMVGFADQSNFARAFKRWTGVSPGEYQKAA